MSWRNKITKLLFQFDYCSIFTARFCCGGVTRNVWDSARSRLPQFFDEGLGVEHLSSFISIKGEHDFNPLFH